MPMTQSSSRARVEVTAVRYLFWKTVLLLEFLASGLSGSILYAQSIDMKLIDGRNGHPMSHTCIDLGVDDLTHMLAIPTDKDGVARLQLTEKDAEINLQKPWKACGNWGVIDPVVKHSDTIAIHVGFVLCQRRKADYSWLAISHLSTKEVLQQGIVTGNTCGKATASPRPGEVVIFVRPLTWRERMKQ